MTYQTIATKFPEFHTRRHCLKFFPVFLAFESSKEPYLKLRQSLDIVFRFPLEFYQFDDKIYSSKNFSMTLWLTINHLYDTNSLDFNSVFVEYYGNAFIICLQKNRRTFVSPQINTLRSQCNTLRRLTYYKQHYCKDIQIYIVFHTHER